MLSVPQSQGAFVLSLDFELMWGVYPSQTLESYGANVLGVRNVVPQLLELFLRFGIKATWATVGFLFFDDRDELLAALPEHKPSFRDKRNTTYSFLDQLGENEKKDPYHFGLSLVRRVADCPGQEIATHTFSHYFCLEEPLDQDAFKADIDASIAASARVQNRPRSIVFPRNQVCDQALDVCRDRGINVFRGPGPFVFDAPRARRDEGIMRRAMRLANSYVPRPQTAAVEASSEAGLCNIPASRYLRPCSKRFRNAAQLQIIAIRREMRRAAERGQVFHLWFHPHNFGVNTDDNILMLSHILSEYEVLKSEYGWPSLTMADAADFASR